MNSMPVELLPIARDDVNNALVYIAIEDPDAADRLLAALDQLSRFPLSAPEVMIGGKRLRKYYRVPVHPYNVYYRIIGDRVVVMCVLHERMDAPRYL